MDHRSVTVKIDVDVTPFVAKLATVQLDAHLTGCRVCAHYVKRRGITLRLAVLVEANRHGISAPLLLCRYVTNSVHARHLAGDTLSTRPFTEALRRRETWARNTEDPNAAARAVAYQSIAGLIQRGLEDAAKTAEEVRRG